MTWLVVQGEIPNFNFRSTLHTSISESEEGRRKKQEEKRKDKRTRMDWTELPSQYLPFVAGSLTFDSYSELIYSTSTNAGGLLQSNHINSTSGLDNKYTSFRLFDRKVNQLNIVNQNNLLTIGDNKARLITKRGLPLWQLE